MKVSRQMQRGVVVTLVSLAACSTFRESSFDADGGADPPDASAIDAEDAAPPPVQPLADGATSDASGCPDGAFCDDFDEGALGAAWTQVEESRGRVELHTANVRSAPHSIRATLDPPDGSLNRLAVLLREFAGATSLHCGFDFYLDERGTSGRARAAYVLVRNPGITSYELNFWLYPNGTAGVEEWGKRLDGSGFQSGTPRFALAEKTWHRIELFVDFAGAMRVSVDGTPRGTFVMEPQTPEVARPRLGIREEHGMGNWTALFDNVVCVPGF